MGAKTRQGSPKPYTLKSVKTSDGSLTQHAVVRCYECERSYSFPWIHRENPTRIITHFERQSWTMYQNKARCPEHSVKRRQQAAIFARINEKEKVMPELRKIPREINQNEPPHIITTYLMTVNDRGEVNLTAVSNAQEMLLGDKTYMVIPR